MEMKVNSSPLREQGLPLIGAALCNELVKQGASDPAVLLCVMLLCLKLNNGGVCLNLSTEKARQDAISLLNEQLSEESAQTGSQGTTAFYKCLVGDPEGDQGTGDITKALKNRLENLFGKDLCNFERGNFLSRIGATLVALWYGIAGVCISGVISIMNSPSRGM